MNTVNPRDRIPLSTWYAGNRHTWADLPEDQQKELSYAATGCLYAYPTWEECRDPIARLDYCVHTPCKIKRGQLPPIAETNRDLRYEMHYNWLRFDYHDPIGRARLARLCIAVRNQAKTTGVYSAVTPNGK